MQDRSNIIKEAIDCLKRLRKENAELKAENERIKRDFLKQNQWLQDQKKEIDELKTEIERLKKENLHYKNELKLSFNELVKSEKWQVFERREKNKYYTALKEIEKLFKKEYTRPAFRNCFGEYPKECKRCLHNGSCLQQQVLNTIKEIEK